VSARVGLGFDVHPFGGEGPLVLAGVTIPGARGLSGHSDADVVAHAVADALLGAVGLPDLGARFPPGDDRYRDADSMVLLHDVAAELAADGWRATNVDVSVAAEQPRLAPFVPDMVRRLEHALAVLAPGSVSVKPKRAEGLGAIGRAEGIAAWAVAALSSLDEQ
jgi:2-C-methyl-D-erythritol 2,4-cyclodiphosphate synthase